MTRSLANIPTREQQLRYSALSSLDDAITANPRVAYDGRFQLEPLTPERARDGTTHRAPSRRRAIERDVPNIAPPKIG
jgi:hypothetical protein